MAERILNIKINDKNYKVKEGTTILSACKQAGITIPTLCYLEDVAKDAYCSICVVEVKGAKSLVRSCIAVITEGMEITTDTDAIYETRKMNLELILANHPLDCMTCEKAGDCELQDLAYRFGIKRSRFLKEEDVFSPPSETSWDSNPFIRMERSKCILCKRCTEACANQAVLEAIAISGRGIKAQVSTPFNRPLEETNCQFCAVCVQACPTGALVEKTRIAKGRITDFKVTNTICAYCGVGCNLELYTDKNNDIVMAKGLYGNDVNKGRTCVKGRFGHEYTNSKERLTSPLIKENGKFRKASWEEAIKYTAKKIKEVKDKYGADSIGVLGSSRCPNEDNYVVQKFARAAIGTNNVDNCARLCHSSTVVGLGMAFGAGAATNSIDDMKDSDVMFVIGSNMSETHPVMAQNLKAQRKKNRAKLIVCDPRCVSLAKEADVYIPHNPGTDVALLNGIMNQIIEQGLENKEFIKDHTVDYEEIKKTLKGYDLETVSKITGVDKNLIKKAAEFYGKAKSAMIFYTMGITQHTTGVDNVVSVANMALITGNIGKPGAGIMALRGQANVQGSCDMGALPNVYTGYQKVDDPIAQEKFEKAWGVKLPNKVGLAVTEFADKAIKGELKAVYAMGENPLMTEADVKHVRAGFGKLDFFATQEIFLSETGEMADVVFPASSTYEKDGTFVNTERRVQWLRPARNKPDGTKHDWQIVCEIATAMGYKMEYESTSVITDEIASLTPSYAGILHRRLLQSSLQWPCLDDKHPGTKILHTNGNFKRPDGKGKFHAISYKPAKELPDKNYPFILTTGRILYHYHSGNETRRVKVLNDFVPRNYVEISVDDSAKLGIKDKEMVKVSTRRGSIELEAKISERPKNGVVFMSFHFSEANANVLTNGVFDPISKIPEYKVAACKIELVKK